jgi:hypothetical protein
MDWSFGGEGTFGFAFSLRLASTMGNVIFTKITQDADSRYKRVGGI